MITARPLKKLAFAAAAAAAVALCTPASAENILDNLGSPVFNTAVGGDRVGAAIQVGETPVTISTIQFHSYFTGGYVFRPGQTFAIYSRNANGTVGTRLFGDFTVAPGPQSPRTTATANSSYVLQANTGYWLVLTKPPGGNFVLWNFTPSTTYSSAFGVMIPALRASFYEEKGETFYFDLQDGPQELRIDGLAATPPAPVPNSVVSRKSHGAAGTFDLELPLTGPAAIESRSGGAAQEHQLVFSFPSPVTVESAAVSSGTGSVASALTNGNDVIVNLTGVPDAQRLTVTLFGVSDGSGTGDVAVRMATLLGDTNRSGSVTASDIGQLRTQAGQAVTASNCHNDVVANGNINATDIAQVKARSGNTLPPAREGVLEKR